MKFHYLVTLDAPDTWVEAAKTMDGMTGREWCRNALGSRLAHVASDIPPHRAGEFKYEAVADPVDSPDTANAAFLLRSNWPNAGEFVRGACAGCGIALVSRAGALEHFKTCPKSERHRLGTFKVFSLLDPLQVVVLGVVFAFGIIGAACMLRALGAL